MIRVRYGVFLRGDFKREFVEREDAEDFVRLCYPGATIETLTYTRR